MVIEFVKLGDTFMPRLLLKLLIGFKLHEVFLGYEKLLMNAEERYSIHYNVLLLQLVIFDEASGQCVRSTWLA